MLFKLSSIINCPGKTLKFRTEIDLSDMEFGGEYIVPEPVVVEGGVENTAGVLILSAVAETTLHCVCDRCLKPVLLPRRQSIRTILVSEDTENVSDEVYPLINECADIDDIATTAFVLGMESKLLCSSDCKGLCPGCGKDLNTGPCSCEPEPDPRFAVLKQLLKSDTTE